MSLIFIQSLLRSTHSHICIFSLYIHYVSRFCHGLLLFYGFTPGLKILLRSLTIKGSLMSGSESDPLESKWLNRHEVLHGRSIDYGTELNSFKAISIINFVGDVIFKAFSAEKNTE